MSLKYPKLHVGQIGFVLDEVGRIAPIALTRCQIVEIIDKFYIMVIFKPDGDPKKILSFDFIPGDRRSLAKAYRTARAVLDLAFHNAFISPREPLFDNKESK